MENDLLFPLSYLVGEKVERKGEEESENQSFTRRQEERRQHRRIRTHQYKISVSVVKA